jgi:hypothetical protein
LFDPTPDVTFLIRSTQPRSANVTEQNNHQPQTPLGAPDAPLTTAELAGALRMQPQSIRNQLAQRVFPLTPIRRAARGPMLWPRADVMALVQELERGRTFATAFVALPKR